MMDDRPPDGALHWASALLAAVVVLALAVPVIGMAAPWERAKRKPSPYAFTNNLKGKAIISAKAVPGISATEASARTPASRGRDVRMNAPLHEGERASTIGCVPIPRPRLPKVSSNKSCLSTNSYPGCGRG